MEKKEKEEKRMNTSSNDRSTIRKDSEGLNRDTLIDLAHPGPWPHIPHHDLMIIPSCHYNVSTWGIKNSCLHVILFSLSFVDSSLHCLNLFSYLVCNLLLLSFLISVLILFSLIFVALYSFRFWLFVMFEVHTVWPVNTAIWSPLDTSQYLTVLSWLPEKMWMLSGANPVVRTVL